ncbi:MAG: NifU family protein [Clostridia bacterium]|nr:NifU family protein [Clostridia bacterium]
MEDYINRVIRPLLRGDGGEIEYVSFDGETLRVTFRGECSFCPVVRRCLDWCEERIEKDVGKRVKISAEKKRPYFRDK